MDDDFILPDEVFIQYAQNIMPNVYQYLSDDKKIPHVIEDIGKLTPKIIREKFKNIGICHQNIFLLFYNLYELLERPLNKKETVMVLSSIVDAKKLRTDLIKMIRNVQLRLLSSNMAILLDSVSNILKRQLDENEKIYVISRKYHQYINMNIPRRVYETLCNIVELNDSHEYFCRHQAFVEEKFRIKNVLTKSEVNCMFISHHIMHIMKMTDSYYTSSINTKITSTAVYAIIDSVFSIEEHHKLNRHGIYVITCYLFESYHSRMLLNYEKVLIGNIVYCICSMRQMHKINLNADGIHKIVVTEDKNMKIPMSMKEMERFRLIDLKVDTSCPERDMSKRNMSKRNMSKRNNHRGKKCVIL
jgi:hypothetical protein